MYAHVITENTVSLYRYMHKPTQRDTVNIYNITHIYIHHIVIHSTWSLTTSSWTLGVGASFAFKVACGTAFAGQILPFGARLQARVT